MNTLDSLLSSLRNAAQNLDSQAVEAISDDIRQAVESAKENRINPHFERLNNALTIYDEAEAASTCRQLIGDLRNNHLDHMHRDITKILKLLNQHRKFELVVKVAETALQTFECELIVTRLYAQALIEIKLLIPSIHILKGLENKCIKEGCKAELVEARGLLGRAYKQIYIDAAKHNNQNTASENAIKNAINFYLNEYQTCPRKRTWHGINAIALYRRAANDGVIVSVDQSENVLNEVIKTIEDIFSQNSGTQSTSDNTVVDKWIVATYAEALVASDQPGEALSWLTKYIGDSNNENKADAFQIGSTLRQFEEVWQLDHNNPDEKKILDVLKAALLSREGGSISLSSPSADLTSVNRILAGGEFEKVFGHDRYKNLIWYKTGLERASNVCRIEDRVGRGIGTGFLLHSSSVGLDQLDQWMILTNAHVVSDDLGEQQSSPGSLAPEDVKVKFEAGESNAESVKITGILATSNRYDLDYSLLSVSGVSDNPVKYHISKSLPQIDGKERLYIIGHPKGGSLSFSLHDNLLLDHEQPKIHYRSPTEGGSSGSPVFNDKWDLIGLHHLGGNYIKKLNGKNGHYEANEGIWIQSVISDIKKQVVT